VSRIELRIPLSESDAQALQMLGLEPTTGELTPLHEVVARLLRAAVDGVTRPMAWERAWIAQLFGERWKVCLERNPGLPGRMQPIVRSLRRAVIR
jgi:hypothetical protein